MNRFWKSLTVLTLLISVIALVAYAAAHPNPYSQERLELQRLPALRFPARWA